MSEKIQKIIANAGICSRRKAETLIQLGKVYVNGKKAIIGDRANISDNIIVNGKKILSQKKVYYMLNKPKGYLCSAEDYLNRKTIFDIDSVKKIDQRVFSVGRLDKDTTGMIILTNDGEFANKLAHPRNEIKKTYIVQLETAIKEKDLFKIERGILIDNKITSPAKARIINSNTVELIIHEGRNRIVRKIMASLNYKVSSLHREKIGNLKLDINEGKIRKLSNENIKELLN